MATKKPSAAQIAARKKFSDIMKAGGFAKKRAAKKTVAKKAVAKKRVTKKNPANVSYRSKPIEDSTAKQLRQWLGETAQFMTDKELNAFKSEAIILGYGKFEPAQIPADVYFKLLRYAQGASRRKNPTILITDTPKKRTVIRRVNPVAKKRVKYTNIAKDMMGELNVGYSVHKQANPSYMAIAWFTNKKDAISVAQEAADRTGVQMAVSRVQTHFMR
jgi:hypothetical protein